MTDTHSSCSLRFKSDRLVEVKTQDHLAYLFMGCNANYFKEGDEDVNKSNTFAFLISL